MRCRSGPRAGGRGVLERALELRSRGTKGGKETEEQGGEDHNGSAVAEHPGVDVETLEEGHPGAITGGNAREEQGQAQLRGDEPDRAAGDCEQRALRQELLHEAAPTRPERHPDRELLLSPRGPGQEEIGDVDAGDQQHEVDADEEEDEDGLDPSDQLVAERDHVARHAPQGVGEARADPVLERGEVHCGPGRR